jgi:cell division septation protein DedD
MSHDKKLFSAVSPATSGAMLFGAVVGGVATAAASARKVKEGSMSPREAALNSLREAGTTGLASGAGVAAMSALRVGGAAGLVGIAVVATGAKYLLDSVLDQVLAKGRACCAPSSECAASASVATPVEAVKPTAMAKPAAKSTAKSARPKAAKPKPPKADPKPESFITE